MIAADPNFRPNPERSIFVHGEIGQDTTQKLTPSIISLQHKCSEPITVFIDSPGGSVHSMFALLRLLKTKNQDGASCRIITVATGQAASAAADLLSAGDYSLAYQGSAILYHGVRIPSYDQLTAEELDDPHPIVVPRLAPVHHAPRRAELFLRCHCPSHGFYLTARSVRGVASRIAMRSFFNLSNSFSSAGGIMILPSNPNHSNSRWPRK